jgi:hypothetical protein
MIARITPLDPTKHRFILTRAAADLAKAQKAHRKGASVAEARRALIRTQARFLAHDVRQAKATTPRAVVAQPSLFEAMS